MRVKCLQPMALAKPRMDEIVQPMKKALRPNRKRNVSGTSVQLETVTRETVKSGKSAKASLLAKAPHSLTKKKQTTSSQSSQALNKVDSSKSTVNKKTNSQKTNEKRELVSQSESNQGNPLELDTSPINISVTSVVDETSMEFKSDHSLGINDHSANSTNRTVDTDHSLRINNDHSANSSAGIAVPDYLSESEGNAEPQPKRRKKVIIKWILENTFANREEASEFIKSEHNWSTATTNFIAQGKKVLYRCKRAKERGIQCEAAVSLLYCSDSTNVILHRTTNEHTCQANPTPNHPLSEQLKIKITEIFKSGLRKRKEIETQLASEGIEVPTKYQLNNLISQLRRDHYGSPKITLCELEQHLLKHLEIPEDCDEPFVVDYICDYDNIDFKFFISTKNLLRNATYNNLAASDSTYKITWQGYPLTPVGTVDLNRHFHLFGTVVSQTENSDDYEFIFKTLKQSVKKIFDFEMRPNILIADASGAIHNGFKAVFGDDVLVLMCFFHAKKAVKKNLPALIPNKTVQHDILEDMSTLQICQTPDQFNEAARLFLMKYKEYEDFCEYFKQQWLIEHPNWYEGITTEFVPSTNNAMESWNRLTKDEKTKRIRFPLDTFFPKLLQWTKEWSQQYTSKAKKFDRVVTLDTKLWTDAYKWAKLNKPLKECTDDTNGLSYFDFSAGLSKSKPMASLPTTWTDFDNFAKVQFSQWRAYVSRDWQNGTCNCPVFKKKYMCKHIPGIAIRRKYVEPPLQAKTVPLEKKRKPGRPSKTKKALERQ